jgi:[ribosomal protein S5]-alanine N-acetyltransferase
MTLLELVFRPETPAPLTHGPVLLRTPEAGDFEAYSALRQKSRAFLEPWEPSWHPAELKRFGFRQRIKGYLRDIKTDAAYPFFIFDEHGQTLLGGINLNNVRRGAAQSATLGYWIGEPFANMGYMSAAMQAILPFAFNTLCLHRVEAACLPANEPSRALLARAGFREEGLSKSYLQINGEWEDHLRFAKLA